MVPNASLEIDDIKFEGNNLAGMVVHAVSGSVVLNRVSIDRYPGFAISVHNNSRLSVGDSNFSHNGVSNASLPFAGCVYNEGSNIDVHGSTFLDNHSVGLGGAIVSLSGSARIAGNTFVNNGAETGGAIALSNAVAEIVNNTFVGNRARSGGALSARGTSIAVRNCTFSENGGQDGTIAGNPQVFASIIVDHVTPSTAACQLGGADNIQWPATLAACGSGFRFANPNLGVLASNGGPTQTLALRRQCRD